MGVSLFSLNFNLRCPSNAGITERFIQHLALEYLRPKSILASIFGGPDYVVMEGGINDPRKKDASFGAELLKNEQPLAGTNYTILEAEHDFLSIPRDNPSLHAHLETLRRTASDRLNIQGRDAEIYTRFWGLTKAHYYIPDGQLRSDWILREKLVQFDEFVPLTQVSLTEDCAARMGFDIHLTTWSRVWSKFTSIFDESAQDWIRKPSDLAEIANVVHLCDVLCQFFHDFPDAEMSWEFDQDHSPRLGELVVLELERRLGKPNIERKVCEMPFFTA